MGLLIFQDQSIDTLTTRDIRVSGQSGTSVTNDIRITAQASTNATRDIRLSAGTSPLAYVGPFTTATATGSSATMIITSPTFVTAGSHIILEIAHSSGGNVTGATDTRSNTWTVDAPSTFNGTTGVAVISAHINNSIQIGDQITVTWSAAVTQKAVAGEVFRGIATATYVDRTAWNADINYLVNTGTTLQTQNSNEIILGAIAVPGAIDINFVPDGGFTETTEVNSQLGNANNRTITGAFKIVSAQGTYNVTGTLT